jgi:hypothetical protein
VYRSSQRASDSCVGMIRSLSVQTSEERLTLAQAQRLCGVEHAVCRMVLDALVDEKFLCLKSDGQLADSGRDLS